MTTKKAEEIARKLFTARGTTWSGTPCVVVDSPFANHAMPVLFTDVASAEAYADRLAAPIAAAIESALAERDAGEAERVAKAVAEEREALIAALRERRDGTDPAHCSGLNVAINMIQLRASATSPAPKSVAAERAVVEAAVRLMTPPSAAGDATAIGPRLHGAILDLQAARAAARKDGAK